MDRCDRGVVRDGVALPGRERRRETGQARVVPMHRAEALRALELGDFRVDIDAVLQDDDVWLDDLAARIATERGDDRDDAGQDPTRGKQSAHACQDRQALASGKRG